MKSFTKKMDQEAKNHPRGVSVEHISQHCIALL